MLELIQYDEFLFGLLNGEWTNSFLDAVMPVWRNKYFWIPMYVFFLAFVGINYSKRVLPFILMAVLTLAISDTMSSRIIKNTVQRDRPCRNELLPKEARVLVKCGGGYSFTSSHATNHFAIGLFFFLVLGSVFKYSKWLLILWAASICYGQVYVGVHYPFDVLVGAILGFLIGTFTGNLFNRYWNIDNIDIDIA